MNLFFTYTVISTMNYETNNKNRSENNKFVRGQSFISLCHISPPFNLPSNIILTNEKEKS